MSGVRAPLELALVWCGWKVATYELEGTPFNPPRDLMDPEVRRQAEEDIELADLLTFQMDCSTLTRAKEIPMRGPARHIKALPMRSSGQYLRGLPRLEEPGAEAEKKRVEDANSLLDWGTGQMHRQLDKGDAALLENPKNSYAWEFGEVDRLLERGCVDYDHDACAHGGARAKKQKWRGNVPQITERRGDCHHIHSPDEWQPVRVGPGDVKLAAKEEQEYTAHHVFYLAVQISIWAVLMGKAKLAIPKVRIVPQETGSRLGWHKLPPAALREWAMPGFGLRLQLQPPQQAEPDYSGLPTIESVNDLQGELGATTLYVGGGHARRKLARSTWDQEFRKHTGAEAEPEYALAAFSVRIAEDPTLQQAVVEMTAAVPWRMTLAVDTAPGQPSHAEVLARWMWHFRRGIPAQQGVARPTKAPRVVPPRVLPAARPSGAAPAVRPTRGPVRGLMVGAALPSVSGALEAHVGTEWRWTDVVVHRALRKFFPEAILKDFPLPPLEDLVNDERLAAWRIWAEQEGVAQAPIQSQARTTGWECLAVGKQRAATGGKHAIDAVVGFGMGKDAHYEAACTVALEHLDPWSMEAKAAPDLRFAAAQVVQHHERPRQIRQELQGLIKELGSRTRPLSQRLREAQPWHVRQVAGKLQLGFIAVVCLLTLWGDGKMPGRFISSFQRGRRLEESRLWDLIDAPLPVDESVVFEQFQKNKDEVLRRPMEEKQQFLWDSCVKEVSKHVALRQVPEQALRDKYGVGSYSAIPCFTHTQACGKDRRIDNAKKSRDNEATQYSEKFRLANAYAPAVSARLLFRAGRRLGLTEAQVWHLLDLESGGEDLPDAFRTIPVEFEFLRRNIVMVRHPQTGKLWYFQMLAALFGQGSSVYSFERWSAFLEAAPRRLLWLMWVMYVDDGSLVDLAGAKGAGQALIHTFFDELGTGLSPDKRECMSKETTFLGVGNSFKRLQQTGRVLFWPKAAIEGELRAQMDKFMATEQCPPGDASKFRGVAGFAAEAQFGQLGKAPMRPFKQRQYWDKPPWGLSHTMRRAVGFTRMLLNLKLQRAVRVVPDERPSLVVASDAQVEPHSWPGGGTLIYDPVDQSKVGGWLEFKSGALRIWDLTWELLADGRQPIALCEAAMVPLSLIQWPDVFRGRSVVWYIDNTSAMASFVKGTSANEIVLALCLKAVHVGWFPGVIFCFFNTFLRCWVCGP